MQFGQPAQSVLFRPDLHGRTLKVNEAKPREERGSGGSHRYCGGGYNSDRGGGGGNRW
jgi:hypothetical protein